MILERFSDLHSYTDGYGVVCDTWKVKDINTDVLMRHTQRGGHHDIAGEKASGSTNPAVATCTED